MYSLHRLQIYSGFGLDRFRCSSVSFSCILFVISFAGGIIIYGALWLFEDDFVHVVSITFTSLILTELLMVGLTIRTWHYLMIVAEIFSLCIYIASLAVLSYFGKYIILCISIDILLPEPIF